jgi:hypothetical protein
MIGFSDLPDPKKGRQVFKAAYGPQHGPRRFRKVLRVLIPLVVIAVIGAFILADWHLVKAAYSEVSGWFSPPSTIQSTPGMPSQQGNCIIDNSAVSGTVIQTCK